MDREGLTVRLEALRAETVGDPRLAVWEVTIEGGDGEARLEGWTTLETARDGIDALARETGVASDVRLLPDPALGEAIAAVAHRSLAHLRREPRHASELVTQIVLGEEALILRARGEWLQVQAADGYVGWAHQGSLVRRAPDGGADAFRERLAARRPPEGAWIVTARTPLARAEARPDAAVACDLVRGARVVVAGERGEWLRIELPDGLGGWIPSGDALPRERLRERFPREGGAVVEHASEYLGLPYLWGGTSEKGFDCSGLVQRVYELHGVALPRDSDQQSTVGNRVDTGDDWGGVEDGDLAFFAESPGGRATHVGILSAGGRLIHASTTRNGVAWDVLRDGGERSVFGARLVASLTGIRRVLR